MPEATRKLERRLVICCDGTWNKPDRRARTTNVVRMARAILPESRDGLPQIVYYHPGVGTGNFLDRWAGGAAGIGLSENVRSAYAFLVDTYRDGDEIFFFGFSRGAYTVRSVAGLIGHVGLLRKRDMVNFEEVWDYYRQPEAARAREEGEFLANFPDRVKPQDIRTRCIGVWDTVGSLGIPHQHLCRSAYQFHDTNLGPGIEFAFQALAIDEQRTPFAPAIWHRSRHPRVDQTVEQVWFPGVHSNIGGGYPEHGLSDAAFFWMASRVSPLLDLDLDYIVAQADRRRPYALGRLQNSLSFLYRLSTGRYVRPICVKDPETEKIHESVWMRAFPAAAQPVPAPYRDAAFRSFLKVNDSKKAPLSSLEKDILGRMKTEEKERILPRRFRNRTFCDRLISALGGTP
jgi:hypothetical protein